MALSAARNAGEDEPAIPALPDTVINATTELYATMYERITGRVF